MSIFCDIMSPEYINMSRQFYVNHDHCGNPEHYENYIRQDCFTDYKQGMGVTHVFVDDEKGRIIGYITLRATSLIMDIGENYRLGYPALEIAELAVEKDYERQGIGAEMVMYAINEAQELNEKNVGIQYVVLCADPEAVGFYSSSKLGFKKIRIMQELPREHRNSNCEPMMLKIVENT